MEFQFSLASPCQDRRYSIPRHLFVAIRWLRTSNNSKVHHLVRKRQNLVVHQNGGEAWLWRHVQTLYSRTNRKRSSFATKHFQRKSLKIFDLHPPLRRLVSFVAWIITWKVRCWVTDTHHTQTHRPSTVTLAAHARRGLMMTYAAFNQYFTRPPGRLQSFVTASDGKLGEALERGWLMHLSMVCPTWHTWGRCWRKKGNLALESSPRGQYLVGIVKTSRKIHELTALGLDDHCHNWFYMSSTQIVYIFSFIMLIVFGKFHRYPYIPVTHCTQEGDMGYL